MDLLQTKRYPVNNPLLKQLIKYYWVIHSDHPVTVNHKLLPVSNIDIVINFSPTIKYISERDTVTIPKGFHFNGIRDRYYYINQVGQLNVFGISFLPTGLYPLIKTPLSEFTNQTLELDLFIKEFTSRITDKFQYNSAISTQFKMLENELAGIIDFELVPKEINQVFTAFDSNTNHLDIHHFCDWYGINQRQLERIFKKYLGISPKQYLRFKRFHGILNRIINTKNPNFVSVAYENDYYDQTHFIKDFKLFTGCSPSQFILEKRSVKEILKLI